MTGDGRVRPWATATPPEGRRRPRSPRGPSPEWDAIGQRLAAMGVLQREQGDAFELLVRAKVRYLRLAAKVREMGEVLADAKGDLYRNPHAIAMEKAEVEVRRLRLEFGLTPAAATRVRADVEQAAEGDADQRRFFSLVAGKRRKASAP